MRLLSLIVLSTLGLAGHASQILKMGVVNPETYASPSGRYKLWINPDDVNADAGAKYRLSLDGKVVWEKHFPFALSHAGITNEGQFGGYAVREPQFDDLIVIGTKGGEIALSESHKLRPSPIEHGSPLPLIKGLIFDAAHDRMTVRVFEGDEFTSREYWWTYRLSDAKPGPKLDPGKYMEAKQDRIVDVRSLPGTPLTLLSWSHFANREGAVLTVVDSDAKPVWRVVVENDYEIGNDEYERADSVSKFAESGSILAVADKRFDVRFVRKNQRATYQIRPTGQGWKVGEVARRSFRDTTPKEAAYPTLPAAHLILKKKWVLPLRKLPVSPIHDIDDFGLAGVNRIATVRRGESPALILSDMNGRKTTEIRMPMLATKNYPGNRLTWLGGTKFVVTHSPEQRKESSKGWLVDAATKRIRLFADFGNRRISSIASFKDGSIVVTAGIYHPYTTDDVVAVYGANGRLKWERSTAGGYRGRPDDLLSPEDVDVDPKGRVIILDNVRKVFQIFSATGKFISNISYSKKENDFLYTTHLRSVGTGYLIWDSPSAYFIDAFGKVRGKFEPRFANTRLLDSIDSPQVDADGSIWISDGDAIYRLSRSFIIDRTVGRVGGLSGLREVSSLIVTQKGRVNARDKTSDEVHVFDSSGIQTAVLQPQKNDLPDTLTFGVFGDDLIVDNLGRIYVSRSNGYVRYSAFGQREGVVNFGSEEKEFPLAAGKRGLWWRGTDLRDEDGHNIASIDRLPGENWLVGKTSVAVGPTDEVAVTSFTRPRDKNVDSVSVGFYDRTGTPESTAAIAGKVDDYDKFSYGKDTVFFTREQDILAFDKMGKGLWRFPLPVRKGAVWQAFSSLGGLAVFDGIDTVYWYEIPK